MATMTALIARRIALNTIAVVQLPVMSLNVPDSTGEMTALSPPLDSTCRRPVPSVPPARDRMSWSCALSASPRRGHRCRRRGCRERVCQRRLLRYTPPTPRRRSYRGGRGANRPSSSPIPLLAARSHILPPKGYPIPFATPKKPT